MKQYIVDAFSDKVFGGNPAAVCILEKWLDEDTMMKITKENNLSDTAFAVKAGDHYDLRWFTPGGEVDLCGHATLATAYVITRFIESRSTVVNFQTMSGVLTVKKNDSFFSMDFPAYALKSIEVTSKMSEAIGYMPSAAFLGRDLICILNSESEVKEANIVMEKVKELPGLLLHITAQGQEYVCVSRSFAPKLGVLEDPVCGSGHCHLVPYWSEKSGKKDIIAYQASDRGGVLFCENLGARIELKGQAALYSVAEIFLK